MKYYYCFCRPVIKTYDRFMGHIDRAFLLITFVSIYALVSVFAIFLFREDSDLNLTSKKLIFLANDEDLEPFSELNQQQNEQTLIQSPEKILIYGYVGRKR